jgi:predicted GNAT family acetyltransferase
MGATVEQLGPRDSDALRAFLATDPIHNLYMLGLLEEFGVVPKPGRAPFAFIGRFQGRELTAVLFVGGGGGLVVPSLSSPSYLEEITALLRGKVTLRTAIGEAGAVDVVARHLCAHRPKLARAQKLYKVSADDLGPFTNPTLRLATEADLPQLVPMAAHCVQETVNRDPLAEDPEGFQERVRQRVRGKRTYVLPVGEKLVFKIDVGSRSQFGAEIEGLYTLPDERRRGHATLSLGQISRHLLSSLPRLTLRIDDRDNHLAQVARRVGFIAGKSQRLVVDG